MALTVPRLPRAPSATDTTVLVAILGMAAIIELAILRTFTRTAIHIPALEHMQGPYEALAGAGRYAYFVAIGLSFPVLGLLGLRIAGSGHPARWLAAFGVAGFGAVALAAMAGAAPDLALGAATIWAVTMLAVAMAARSGFDVRESAPTGLFAASFALSGSFVLLPDVPGSVPQPGWLLDGAELTGLAFAMALPFVVAGRDRGALMAAIGVGVFALAVFLGNGSTSRFLLLWNVGLSGTLPGVAYAVAAAAIGYAGLRLLRTGSPLGACGVVLLVAGGIGLHSSYQSALVVAGLAALYIAFSERTASRSAA